MTDNLKSWSEPRCFSTQGPQLEFKKHELFLTNSENKHPTLLIWWLRMFQHLDATFFIHILTQIILLYSKLLVQQIHMMWMSSVRAQSCSCFIVTTNKRYFASYTRIAQKMRRIWDIIETARLLGEDVCGFFSVLVRQFTGCNTTWKSL
jgi:hypothetical protein